jgi:hypothetical protein
MGSTLDAPQSREQLPVQVPGIPAHHSPAVRRADCGSEMVSVSAAAANRHTTRHPLDEPTAGTHAV